MFAVKFAVERFLAHKRKLKDQSQQGIHRSRFLNLHKSNKMNWAILQTKIKFSTALITQFAAGCLLQSMECTTLATELSCDLFLFTQDTRNPIDQNSIYFLSTHSLNRQKKKKKSCNCLVNLRVSAIWGLFFFSLTFVVDTVHTCIHSLFPNYLKSSAENIPCKIKRTLQ